MILLAQGFAAEAAEVKVIAAAPISAVFKELGPQFERDTGHKLVTKFASTPVVKREIDAGETFDLASPSRLRSTTGSERAKLSPAPVRLWPTLAWAWLYARATQARYQFGRGVQACAAQCEISCLMKGSCNATKSYHATENRRLGELGDEGNMCHCKTSKFATRWLARRARRTASRPMTVRLHR